ncbi:hypothetical protein CHH75_03985 [Paenibacillus sp. 7541]|nr:hypothetical protein CHH75_03985 [Paenibacillus sp. 7541]
MIRKEDALKKIQNFLIENKDVPTAWRSELVKGLTEELESEGVVPALYYLWTMKHPALLRKGAKQQTIGEILADFILNIDEIAERKAEYPVLGPEKAHRDDKRRERHVNCSCVLSATTTPIISRQALCMRTPLSTGIR